jgi:hypothetical protein
VLSLPCGTGDSDDDGEPGIIMGDAGAAFIDAGAAAAAAGNGPGQLLDDLDSSEEEPDSEDGGGHHHVDAFEDALLAEEEMAMMADHHMDGHVQEVSGWGPRVRGWVRRWAAVAECGG